MKIISPANLMLILIGLLVAACSVPGRPGQGDASAQGPLQTPTPTPEKRISIEVTEVELGDISQFLSYAGDLQPQKSINIVPEMGGKIETLLIDVGDQVSKGDLIATVDQEAILLELRRAEVALKSAVIALNRLEAGTRPEEIAVAQAQVVSAKAQLNEVLTIDDDERTQAATSLATTEATLKQAQQAYDRVAWAGDIGTRPESLALQQATIAYETALANYNLAVNPRDSRVAPLMENMARAELTLSLALNPYRDFDFAAAEANIEAAEASIAQIEHRLQKTSIYAPFDGVISKLFIEEGSIVNTQGAISELISNEIEVLINAEESVLGGLSVGQSAVLQVQAYPGVDFPAVVTSIDPVGDSASRTFPVTITPVDEEGLLKSGMYADLSILSQEKRGVPLVPRAAIVTVNNETTVFVVLDQNTVELRSVVTGLSSSDQVEVLEGLKAGEVVVIAGQPNLADGAKIDIVSGF